MEQSLCELRLISTRRKKERFPFRALSKWNIDLTYIERNQHYPCRVESLYNIEGEAKKRNHDKEDA